MDRRPAPSRLIKWHLSLALSVVIALVLALSAGCSDAGPVVSADQSSTLSVPTQATTESPAASSTSALSSTTDVPTASSTLTSTTAARAPAPSTLAPVVTTEPAPRGPLVFDSIRAMEHIERLAVDIGIRPGGTAAEDDAATYASEYLAGLGYLPVTTDVPLHDGDTSHNVTVVKKGASPLTMLVGAHLDTKPTTPGGNDNASGCAAVLELARDIADAGMTPTIILVLFGHEEIPGEDKNQHHFGSRSYVANMTAAERENLVGMISLDMIAFGDTLTVRTMGKGPVALRNMLQAYARSRSVDLAYLKDPGSSGYSDHEPFELAGYPSAWLEWREDPEYHTASDTYEHCDQLLVRKTGRLVLGFLADLTPDDLSELRASVTN